MGYSDMARDLCDGIEERTDVPWSECSPFVRMAREIGYKREQIADGVEVEVFSEIRENYELSLKAEVYLSAIEDALWRWHIEDWPEGRKKR